MLSRESSFVLGMVFVLAFSVSTTIAHSDDVAIEKNLEELVIENSLNFIIVGSVIISVSVIAAMLYKGKKNNVKVLLFAAITIPTIAITLAVAGGTIYLNLNSVTGGPVHYHVDYEIWNCNERVDLIDPTGLTNRIGTPVLHEHNDDRIHVEGVVVDYPDISLHSYFSVIGGSMTDNSLLIPTNDGTVQMLDGADCNGHEGKFQVFLYKVLNPDDLKNWEYVQEKLTDEPSEYVMSPYSIIPPGDCIIFELGEVAIDKGEMREAQ